MLISHMLTGVRGHASPRNAHTGPCYWGNPTSDPHTGLGHAGSLRPLWTTRVAPWLGQPQDWGCKPWAPPGRRAGGEGAGHCHPTGFN